MHSLWCGKDCCYCDNPCDVDKSIPCSPDCEFLLPSGDPDPDRCKGCEVYDEILTMGYMEV